MQLSSEARVDGYRLVHLPEVGSSNQYGLDLAQSYGADRTFIVTDMQTGGRGRHGRIWYSPPGNLYMSLLLLDPCPMADAPKLGFVAGVALAETARHFLHDQKIRLKWPNDLVYEGAKLSGILLEGRKLADGTQAIVLGVGVNIRAAPEIEGRQVAALNNLGADCDRDQFFEYFSGRLAIGLSQLDQGRGAGALREAWLALALPKGQSMTVRLPRETLDGRFAGLDDHFRLMLETVAGPRVVDAGDVFLNDEKTAG